VAAPADTPSVSSIFGDAKPRDAKLFSEPEVKKAFARREGGADKPKTDRKERKEGDAAAGGAKTEPKKTAAAAAPADLTPIVRGQVPPEPERKPRERKDKPTGAGAEGAEKRNGKVRSNSNVSGNSGGAAAPSGKKDNKATAATAAKPKAPKVSVYSPHLSVSHPVLVTRWTVSFCSALVASCPCH
jgi:hypothetical protein